MVLPREPSYVLQDPNSQRIPFPEVLRAYNRFEAGSPWIDLRPLMELRIENAYYKEGSSRRGLDGFLGTEIARYAVGTQGLQLLSVIPMHDRPPTEMPVQDLISSSETKFKHYRFYYEIVFARKDRSHGSVLLGADSAQDLNQLSKDLRNPASVCYPGATHCTVFPEACSVSVEMWILVNGKPRTVVWGASLRNVVTNPHHLVVKRLFKGQPTPIRMDFNDPKALLLPLLPGDQIDWS